MNLLTALIMEAAELPEARVVARRRGGLVVVEARGLRLEVSEPPEHGGKGDRFNPLELLMASLASCEAFLFSRVAEALFGEWAATWCWRT